MAYIVETRDSRERWHRPRLGTFASFAAAAQAASEISGITAWRIVNRETGAVEYTELVY